MDKEKFGEIIKELRKRKGLTQSQLAEGICTREYLYRVEKGQYVPSSIILEALSYKLSEDLSQYLLLSNYNTPLQTIDIKKNLEKNIYQGNYKNMAKQIAKARKLKDFELVENKQLLFWYDGIFTYEQNQNFAETLSIFIDALKLTKEFTQLQELYDVYCTLQEIRILISISKLYHDKNQFDKFVTLGIKLISKLKNHYSSYDESLYLRLNYNVSLGLLRMNRYEEALEYADIGIKKALSTSTPSLLILAELQYQKGRCLHFLDKHDQAYKHFRFAMTIFEMVESKFYNKYKKLVKEYFDYDY